MSVFAAIVVVVQILTSILLVLLILLHSGKGGGLSDMFGGGMGPVGMGGSTVAERNLDRYTVIIGLVWLTTTVALSFIIT